MPPQLKLVAMLVVDQHYIIAYIDPQSWELGAATPRFWDGESWG